MPLVSSGPSSCHQNETIPTIKFPVTHIVDHLLFGAEIQMRKN